MISDDDPRIAARKIALRRLDRRECSTGDISQCLKRQGFSIEVISQVLEELVEKKYINNDKYAQILIREQALRGKGPTWIRMKLKGKGIHVERGIVEAIMGEVTQSSELSVAKAVVARRYSQVKENPLLAKKALQALLRRGFSFEVAKQALLTFDQETTD
jgi:regulatory protein